MAGDVAAPPETLGVSHPDNEVEQLGAGDIGVGFEIVATGLPDPRQGIADGVFVRVVAEHVGASEVGLPLLENRTEVEEHNVVVCDDPVRGTLLERLQSVLAGPHNPPMPVSGDSELLCGQCMDLVGQLPLADAGADHRAALDLVEQFGRLGFGVQKPFHAYLFVGDRIVHSIDATASEPRRVERYSAGVTANPVAILFDLQGTCVDFYTSVIDTCRRVDAGRHPDADWDGLLTEWRRYYAQTIGYGRQQGQAAPWRSARAVYRDGLRPLLPSYGLTDYSSDDIDALALAWEEQRRPWPDVAEGLERLAKRHTLAVLTNIDVAAMTRTVKAAGLRFDLLLSVQMFAAYKPDPRAYLGAAEYLALRPDQLMLVACHVYDVQGAHEQGFQTAFVPRPDERGPGHGAEPAPSYGLIARDFIDLAEQLGC